MTFSAGVGVAQPRQDVQAALNAESGTAMSGFGNDFATYGSVVTVAASDWTAAGGAFTATKTITDVTYQDDKYEGSEQFNMILHRSNPIHRSCVLRTDLPAGDAQRHGLRGHDDHHHRRRHPGGDETWR